MESYDSLLGRIKESINSGNIYLSRILLVYFEKKYPKLFKNAAGKPYKEFIKLYNFFYVKLNEILSLEDDNETIRNPKQLFLDLAKYNSGINLKFLELKNVSINNSTKSKEYIYIIDGKREKNFLMKIRKSKDKSESELKDITLNLRTFDKNGIKIWVINYKPADSLRITLDHIMKNYIVDILLNVEIFLDVNKNCFIDVFFETLIFLNNNPNLHISKINYNRVNKHNTIAEYINLILSTGIDFGLGHIRNFNLNPAIFDNAWQLLGVQTQGKKNISDRVQLSEEESKFITEIGMGDEKSVHNLKIIYHMKDEEYPILLLGETGVGKTRIAEIIHKESNRKDKPFQHINCAAIPTELIESELFGAKKGAYTGASADIQGKIKAAEGGTLFLDEFTEAPISLQSKLLSFVETKEYHMVGESKPSKANVRIIFATNKELHKKSNMNFIREDFYYRISFFKLSVPPLRERIGAIESYTKYFITNLRNEKNKYKDITISEAAIQTLCKKEWPGNVRQLKNTLVKVIIDCIAYNIREINTEIIDRNYETYQVSSPISEFEQLLEQYFIFWNEKKEKVIEKLKTSNDYNVNYLNYIDGFLKPLIAEFFIKKYNNNWNHKDIFSVVGMSWERRDAQIIKKQKLYQEIKKLFEE